MLKNMTYYIRFQIYILVFTLKFQVFKNIYFFGMHCFVKQKNGMAS